MRIMNLVTSCEHIHLEMERREVNGHCSLFESPCYGKGVGAGKRSGEGRNIKMGKDDLFYFSRQGFPDKHKKKERGLKFSSEQYYL